MRLQFVCFHNFLLSRIKNDFYLTPISTLLNFTRAINFDNPFGSHIDQLYNLKSGNKERYYKYYFGIDYCPCNFLTIDNFMDYRLFYFVNVKH